VAVVLFLHHRIGMRPAPILRNENVGFLPLSHARDGGGSIPIPTGICGNLGLKPSRCVFSATPDGSDLMAVI